MYTDNHKICSECSQEFDPVRSDQKFCSSKCRYRHKNGQHRPGYHAMKTINKILAKNRAILERLCEEVGEKSIHASELTDNGYRLEYFTNYGKIGKNTICYYCYEFGVIKLGGNQIQIIKL